MKDLCRQWQSNGRVFDSYAGCQMSSNRRDAYVVLWQKEGNLAVKTSGGNVTLGQLLEQMTCMYNQLLTILLI